MTIISPLAGKAAPASMLVDVARLVTAYYNLVPDPSQPLQRVAFGTSGHRGSSFACAFNEAHVLAITQAICTYRAQKSIDGPLFIGIDTHALSEPAFSSALEVLAANGVQVMMAANGEYTPTPAVSHAILCYNRGRTTGLADGIVVTPSHNPPDSGGFKYNAINGGPADTDVTGWIGQEANRLLEAKLEGVKRMPFAQARRAATTHEHDFLNAYVDDLANVVDMETIRNGAVRIGVDPLGGAGVHYWAAIAERYKLDLAILNTDVDATFRFMPLDWDGQIRMDPTSTYAMTNLTALRSRFDVTFACDTDHDRHGIITPEAGLMPANHYLSVAVDYLFRHREQWSAKAGVGKTVVSSRMIEMIAAKLGRTLVDVPVGFKWFSTGLFDGSLGFGGEESGGAAFLRRDGSVWTTDKDGMTAGLLAAEITARTGRNPGERYRQLSEEFGAPVQDRRDAPATPAQKAQLAKLSADQVTSTSLAGEEITAKLTVAPGNGAAIGGLKVCTASGWFAARPSGTEDLYKIYAESFRDDAHLQAMLSEAQQLVDKSLGGAA